MKSFEIPVGQSRQLLRFEPQQKSNTFKIYAADKAEDWLDREQQRQVDLPTDGLLGTITVRTNINLILMEWVHLPARTCKASLHRS
jgi:hypothetical protein